MTLKRMKATAVIFAALAVSAPVWGQPSEDAKTSDTASTKSIAVDSPELKDALETMKSYDFGKDRTFLFVIDEAIRQSANKNEQRKRLGNMLAELAVDDNLTYGARELALRRLEQIGDGPQVERIEKLLSHKDERLAEMARQTIAGIPADRANKALLGALKNASGKLQIGIIHSLGERQVKAAIKPLTELARQGDTNVASQAMLALGDIANADAAKALLDDIRPPDPAREAWFIAMNDAAAGLAQHNNKLALRLYDRVLQMGENSPARLAAFKGKTMLDGNPEAAALNGLDDKDPMLAQVARELLVRGKDASITSQLLSRLKTASPEKKVVVAEILGARGDKAALEAISALAEKSADNADLQVASIRALKTLGDEKVAPLLVTLAANSKGEPKAAAEATLKEMPVPEVDTELLRLAQSAATPEEQVVAIETISARKSPGAMDALIAATAKNNPKASLAAFKAMADLTTYKELGAILTAHGAATEERVLREGARAVQAASNHYKNKSDGVKQVIAAYGSAANDDVRASLLGALGNLGTPEALQVIRENLASENEKIQEAAVRALAAFPDVSALDDLLKIATDGKSEVHRVLAIRAVARLMSQPSGKSSTERLAMVNKALELATGPDEKKAVIGGMAEMTVPGLLPLLVPFVDQPDFRSESVAAILKQAPIANQYNPSAVAELLNPLKDKLETEEWNKLEEALTPTEAAGGVVRAWSATPVYKLDAGTTGTAVENSFVPNDQPAEFSEFLWAGTDESGDKLGRLNLHTYYPETKNAAIYLQVNVWSPEDRKVRIDSGSDDGMRIFLNGTPVFAHDQKRAFGWWSDKTEINLNRGWNQIVLKVGQGNASWVTAARIVDVNGKAMTDLKFSAVKQGE